jgi:hypothetical protein
MQVHLNLLVMSAVLKGKDETASANCMKTTNFTKFSISKYQWGSNDQQLWKKVQRYLYFNRIEGYLTASPVEVPKIRLKFMQFHV